MLISCIRYFGLAGISAIWFAASQAQPLAGPPPGTTPYKLNVPPGFPAPPVPTDNPLTNEGVALGLRLFADKQLSGNNTQACISCHKAADSFSDEGNALSTGSTGVKGTRNAPALFNLVYQHNYFWDGKSATLRDQALVPIQNPIEMNQSLTAAVAKLNTDATYPAQFKKAFGSAGITSARIGLALEQYEISLLAGFSKFDLSQRGLATLSAQEQRGLLVFRTPYNPKGNQFGGDCARCHHEPFFSDYGFHNNGLDSAPKDPGREDVTAVASDYALFKTPSLRNLTVSGPYMHDGRFTSLEQVVEHYSAGILHSTTLDAQMAKEPGGVQLSAADQAALVAFLKTLVEPQFNQKVSP